MKLFQTIIILTLLLHIHAQEVVLTPPTLDDIDGDQSSSGLTDWDKAPTLPDLADGNGWTSPEYYSTIRVLADDPILWLFARGKDGMQVYNYDSTSKTWSTLPILSDLADSNGWNAGPEYYSTIQVVHLNDMWLLARNADGLQIYQYELFTQTWTPKSPLPSLSDTNKWNQEEYYSSIQAFSSPGKIWVFARSASGQEVYQYDPDLDSWSTLPGYAALSDANGWGADPKYYSTIQVVQIEENFWLLGRSASGLNVYQYNSASGSWSAKASLPDLSDQAGWGEEQYYSTIQAVVFEGNIWLFARNADGLKTYQYDTEKDTWTSKAPVPSLTDLNGWDAVEYYSTIQAVPLSNSIGLLARGPNGLQYSEYIVSQDTWNSKSTITTLSDANNWNRPEYYTTIKGIDYMNTLNVIARESYGLDLYSYKS